MKRALAALCAVLMLALPCATILAQPSVPTHCHLCAQCDQMHTVSPQPCCDNIPIPTAPQQPQTLEAPAITAHLALPFETAAATAARHLQTTAPIKPSPQRTPILRV